MTDIIIGFTDYSKTVFIPDPASTDGSGKTGLVAANLTVSYTRVETDNDVTVTDVTSSLNDLAALTTAHTDWGIKEVSSTLAPGLYRIDFADAVFASGAWTAVVYVMITTSAAAASPIEFTLVAVNKLDGVRMGLTALPNAAAGANNGLPLGDASGDVTVGGYAAGQAPLQPTTAGRTLDVTATGAAGIDWANIEGKATSVDLTNTSINVVTTVSAVAGDVGGSVLGNLNGSVGGSVFGDVGGNVTGSVGSIAAGGIANTSFADDAITASKLHADVTTELQSGLATAAALATVDGIVDDILLDTAEIGVAGAGLTNINLPNQTMDIVGNITGNLSGSVGSVTALANNSVTAAALAADAVTEIQSGLATAANLATVAGYIDTEIGDIQARLPAALTADGNMKSDALRISGSATAADNLERGALGLVLSTCAAGSSTTAVITNLTEATDDHYNGRVITFTTGALTGQTTSISDYDGTTKTLTVVAMTEAPADTDQFVIS